MPGRVTDWNSVRAAHVIRIEGKSALRHPTRSRRDMHLCGETTMTAKHEDEETVHHGIDDDPNDDIEKGAAIGAIGGAVTGAMAGSTIGPVGSVIGAAIGGVVGAVAGGAVVGAVDRVDDDDTFTGIHPRRHNSKHFEGEDDGAAADVK